MLSSLSSANVIPTDPYAERIKRAYHTFKGTKSHADALGLSVVLLSSIHDMLRITSLPRSLRETLVMYIDQIQHSLDENLSDDKDKSYAPSKKDAKKSKESAFSAGQVEKIRRRVKRMVKNLKDIRVLRSSKDAKLAFQLAMQLAKTGKSLSCSEEFSDLRGFIKHQILDEEEEEEEDIQALSLPTSPSAVSS